VTLIKSISGIRGIIGGVPGIGFTPIEVVKYTSAFAYWTKKTTGQKKIIIGRDARPSGEMILNLVKSTLLGMGMDVVDLGLMTTPTVQIAICDENAAGGIIVTASHNPIQWNALKLFNKTGQYMTAAEGAELFKYDEEGKIEFSPANKLGTYSKIDDYFKRHIDKILKLPLVDAEAIRSKNFNIALDSINSSGGVAVPMLLEALGVKKITLFNGEPNGQFAHNPEPVPENITQICAEISKGKFDLGIVVDPDVDRLALISEDGTPYGEEYTLVAVADYVLSQKPGNTVSNLSSSRALRDITLKRKGKYYASAVIGGEGSGGVIYPVLHYGRDALVGIALFLSHLAKSAKSASMLRANYPNYHISKNKIELTPGIDIDKILNEIRKKYKSYNIDTTDGVRIDFDNEWVHLRKSNTEPIIRIIAEADMESKSELLAKKIISDIKEINSFREE